MKYQSVVQAVSQPITDADLGWLAGLVDGEGSFTFMFSFVTNGRKSGTRVLYTPQITLGMIQGSWQTKFDRILSALGVKSWPYVDHSRNYKGQYMAKMTIAGWKNVLRLSEVLYPHLAVKDKQCKFMLEARVSFGRKRNPFTIRQFDGKQFIRRVDWNAVEKAITITEGIRALNGKKQNVKWTAPRIREAFNQIEGKPFPTVFVTNNPRKRIA